MKKFNNYDKALESAKYKGSAQIPVGAYVCKITNVREEDVDWGKRLVVAFDVSEGEHKDFFKKQFDESTDENKKWKGIARINEPTDDGSDEDDKKKKAFARWTNALEESNSGYSWDWDETKWKGKSIGIIFHQVGSNIDGKDIIYSEVSAPCPVSEVRENKFWDGFLKFYAKKGYKGSPNSSNPSDDFVNVPEGSAEEIPF